VKATEQEAVAVPLAAPVTATGPQTVGPPAEPLLKLTVPVGTAPEAEFKVGVMVVLNVTV
jgi:hypothetical protein